jgi:hypothetical protein
MAVVRGEWDVFALVGCPICGLLVGSATATTTAGAETASPLMVVAGTVAVVRGLVGALICCRTLMDDLAKLGDWNEILGEWQMSVEIRSGQVSSDRGYFETAA